MAEYFAGGHLCFVNGEWRDDNGDAIEISCVRHGWWKPFGRNLGECSECGEVVAIRNNYCPNCGARMDGDDGNSDIA